jgi:tetratricopeptide (TPR) repeat protein
MLSTLVATVLIVAQAQAQAPAQSAVQGRADARAWYQAYDDGVRAVQTSNWQAAISSLELATQRGPAPGRNVNTVGDKFVSYNPYYYLGLAYLNAGRYKDADDAFQRVSKQPNLLTPRDREYATFQSQSARAAFERQMEIADQALKDGRYADARQAANSAKGRSTNADLTRLNGLMTRIDDAERTSSQRASAAPSPAPASPAGSPGRAAAQTPATSTPPLLPAGQSSGNNLGTGTRLTQSPVSLSANNITGPGRRSGAARGGSNRGSAGSVASGNPVQGQTSQPVDQPVYFGDEGLAMTKYFSGDYLGAIGVLTAERINQPVTSRASDFYYACAQAALTLAGRADRTMLPYVRAYYARALAGSPSELQDAKRYVSPRVIQLLETQH